MRSKIFQLKSISVIACLLLFISVGTNELIKSNQVNNYLERAQSLNASNQPQEALVALYEAKKRVNTTLFVKALKNDAIKQIENETQQVKSLEKESEPQYSIEIKETPTLDYLGFTFKATIKNISVKPYITNFGFYECNFIDGENNKYSGSLISTETVFTQAILPDKSQDFIIKDANINIQGLDKTLEGLKKCLYDNQGKNQCNLVTSLKIIDCIGYTTTDGKQASNGWGENPIKVKFP